MLGKLLDRRYQVTQVLGAGGFGRTYLAQDTRRPGNPICVVKQLKPATSDPSFLETARRLFTSEAETLEQLGNHDQIPRLLAYFEEDQEFYLVQEFIEGHTLTQELPPGQPWEESRVIDLLWEVLTILEFVHSHGVIHRDIKPDNLIRRNWDHKLVLVDFGAVKQIRTQLATPNQVSQTIAVGTPGYMSSEQALGQPRPSSDIYALGIIGIQAMTGLMPVSFQEDLNTGEILWEHLVSGSRGLAMILNRMVRYHFKERYQSASEALQALRQLKAGPTPNYPTMPISPVGNPLPNSGQSLGRSHNPAPPSEPPTLPVTPANAQPDNTAATSNNVLPIVIGMVITASAAFGMAYALRQGSFTSLKGSDRNKNQITDRSPGTCIVTANVLNVRSGPSDHVIDTVKKGTSLALTGTQENGWVEISVPVKGWVFNEQRFIDCTLASKKPPETAVSQKPVETPQSKPSTAPPQTVDNHSKTLKEAADQSQQGDFEKAIAIARDIPVSSPAYQEAQKKITQWQQELSSAKEKFDQVQKALDQGKWDEVLKYATDPNFLGQDYWREKLKQLIEEAKKRKAAAEASKKEPNPPESPVIEKPQPSSSVKPSPVPPIEPTATPSDFQNLR